MLGSVRFEETRLPCGVRRVSCYRAANVSGGCTEWRKTIQQRTGDLLCNLTDAVPHLLRLGLLDHFLRRSQLLYRPSAVDGNANPDVGAAKSPQRCRRRAVLSRPSSASSAGGRDLPPQMTDRYYLGSRVYSSSPVKVLEGFTQFFTRMQASM